MKQVQMSLTATEVQLIRSYRLARHNMNWSIFFDECNEIFHDMWREEHDGQQTAKIIPVRKGDE